MILSKTQVNAQNIPAAPVISSVDRNGVDLITGAYTAQTADVAIGGPGSGLGRTGTGFGAPYGDNFTGLINNDGSGNLTVDSGGSSEIFNLVSGAYVSAQGTPNTLSCSSSDCIYTLQDGTVLDYDRTLTSSAGIVANYATLKSITKPDGEIISLYYRSTGSTRYLLSVSSSNGWMLKYHVANDSPANYVPVKVEAINTSVDYCDPTAITCAGETVSWPYGLISTSGPTDALGNHFTYNGGMSSPTSVVSPNGVTKTIAYATGPYAGYVSSVSIGGSTWTYGYGTLNGDPTTQYTLIQDPNGGLSNISSKPALHQVVSTWDELGRTTKFTYYTTTGSGAFAGALSQVIGPEATYSGSTLTGGYTQYTYDGRGNVTSISIYPKGGGTPLTTTMTYPSSCANVKTCNKPLTVTDQAGVTTTYSYDPNSGNVATISKPAVGGVTPQTRYTYTQVTPYVKNSSGALVASTPVWRLTAVSSCMTTSSCAGTSDEAKLLTTYNTNNALPDSTTVARGDANLGNPPSSTNKYRTTTFTYDNFGNVSSIDGPISGANDKTFYFYDVLKRLTGVIGPDPDGSGSLPRQAQIIAYNNDGQKSAVTSGSVTGTGLTDLNAMSVREKSTIEYSTSTGLPVFSKYYPGTATSPEFVTQRSYDALLRVTCTAQRLNSAVFGSLPSDACTPSTTGSDGPDRIEKYNYDAVGRVLSQISGYGTSTPRQDVVTTYNLSGTIATLADDKGNLTSYSYDNFDRQAGVCYPNPSVVMTSSTTDCQQTTYSGGVVSSVTPRGLSTINLSYDADGRTSSVSGAISESFSYDNFNHVTSHTANGITEAYGFDAVDGMTSDAQPTGTVNYTYDIYGRRSQLIYPAYSGNNFYIGYYYYNDGAVQYETESYAGGSETIRAQFPEDSYARSAGAVFGPSTVASLTPTYDTTSRLSALNAAVAGSGNNAAWGFSYSAANQLKSRTQSASSGYNYAPPNNVTTTFALNGLNQIANANGSSFSYDSKGNLTADGSVSYGYNAYNMLTSAGSASLTYDASNRLATLSKSGATTKFLYDGDDLIAEYDGSGNLLRRYVHGPGDNNPVIWFEGANDSTPRYLLSDQLGSITTVTDANGNALAVNAYDEYGLPQTSNSAYQGRFGYTGQVWLPEIGLYNYKNRMYAPSVGRFLQADPIGYGDGLNMYAYAGGDPVNFTDPMGTDADSGQSVCHPNDTNCGATVVGQTCPTGWTCYSGGDFMPPGPAASNPSGPSGGGGGITTVVVVGKRKPLAWYIDPLGVSNGYMHCHAAPDNPGNISVPTGYIGFGSRSIPASEPNMGVWYGGAGASGAVSWMGANGSVSNFTYYGGDGGIYHGTAFTKGYSQGNTFGAGVFYGHSDSTSQFFGESIAFNVPDGILPGTSSVSMNDGGIALTQTWGYSKKIVKGLPGLNPLDETYTRLLNITKVGCWL